MILFWGSKGYQKVLGHTKTAIECGHCNNVGTWEITEYGRKFTLYWIPLFPYGKSYYVSCPVCQYGREIQKSEIETYLNYQPKSQVTQTWLFYGYLCQFIKIPDLIHPAFIEVWFVANHKD